MLTPMVLRMEGASFSGWNQMVISFLNKVIAHDISAEDEFGVDLSLYDNLLLIGSAEGLIPMVYEWRSAYLYRVEQNGSSLLEKIVANDIAANSGCSQYGNFTFVGVSSSDPGGFMMRPIFIDWNRMTALTF